MKAKEINSPINNVLLALAAWLFSHPKLKIFYSVIALYAIDVVNVFPRFKRSAKMFFHNKTMLKNGFFLSDSMNSRGYVSTPFYIPLPLGFCHAFFHAIMRAIFLRDRCAYGKDSAAVSANSVFPSVLFPTFVFAWKAAVDSAFKMALLAVKGVTAKVAGLDFVGFSNLCGCGGVGGHEMAFRNGNSVCSNSVLLVNP